MIDTACCYVTELSHAFHVYFRHIADQKFAYILPRKDGNILDVLRHCRAWPQVAPSAPRRQAGAGGWRRAQVSVITFINCCVLSKYTQPSIFLTTREKHLPGKCKGPGIRNVQCWESLTLLYFCQKKSPSFKHPLWTHYDQHKKQKKHDFIIHAVIVVFTELIKV